MEGLGVGAELSTPDMSPLASFVMGRSLGLAAALGGVTSTSITDADVGSTSGSSSSPVMVVIR